MLKAPLDAITVDITRHLQVACDRLRVEWLIVGATARVILLEHVLGFPPARATRDVDFAVAIDSWQKFDELKQQLEATGRFVASRDEKQRLRYFPAGTTAGRGIAVDLVPFGGVERPQFTIAWSPDADTHLHVFGYGDALASAVEVTLHDDLRVRVASLPGQTLLKISAWLDRRFLADGRDARDVTTLVRSYETAGNQARVYEQDPEVCESLAWDPELMGAHLMGSDARQLASAATQDRIRIILADRDLLLRLAQDMSRGMVGRDDAIEHSERLLYAFARGFGLASN